MGELTGWQRWWLNAWPHRWRVRQQVPKFLHTCPEPFRGQVLEVGAGSGWTSRRILETFPQVELTATDIDEQANDRFRQLQDKYGQRLKVLNADAHNLPFDRASFDIVVAINALRHVDDVPQAVRQFLRVLRPGGLLGITNEPGHTDVFSMEQLTQLIREENCEVAYSEGDTHYILWARKQYPVEPSEGQ